MADRRRRSPEGSVRTERTRKDSRRSVYDEPPRMRSNGAQELSSSPSSSSSSSYLEISRSFPPNKSGLLSFFTAPSERRRVRKRRSNRGLFKINNSSSSSLDGDLAYGTGFIKRSKRSVRSRKGKEIDRERYSERERDKYRERDRYSDRERPGSGTGKRQSRTATDAEILAVGAGLAALAREQNKLDLKNARAGRKPEVMTARETNYGQAGATRGLGPSKPSHGFDMPDEDGWESASDDESDFSVNSALAFDNENNKSKWKDFFGRRKYKPKSRKSTIVDPKLFGPENSLHGVLDGPVGFGDVSWNSSTDFGQGSTFSLGPSESASASQSQQSLMKVYPIATVDNTSYEPGRSSTVPGQYGSRSGPPPGPDPRYEAGRGSFIPDQFSSTHPGPAPFSDPSRYQETTRKQEPSRFQDARDSAVSGAEPPYISRRPEPIPLQQPQPITPVSQSIFEPNYAAQSEPSGILKKTTSSTPRTSSLAQAALAGVAGAVAGAAISSARDDRKDRRREEELEELERDRLRRRDSEKKENKDDRRREKRSSPDRDERKEKSRDKDKKRDDSDEKRRDKKREKRRDETHDDREERRERRREERRGERPESEYHVATQSQLPPSTPPVDPFKYQVMDNAFPTPIADSVEGHRRVGSLPSIVTVEREPDFTRKRSYSIKDQPSTYEPPRDYFPPEETSQRAMEREARDRSLHRAEEIYEVSKHSTAPYDAAIISSAVAAVVTAEEERKSRSERRRDERRSERRGEFDDYKSKPRDKEPAKERDPVQEEADRAYREIVMARKIASEVIRQRTPSPNRSVVDKYGDDEEEEVVKIVTPPEMADQENKKKGPYDAPNADFRPDYEFQSPTEVHTFAIPEISMSRSLPPGTLPKRDPDTSRPRPILNLVRPTPTSSPAPEKQVTRSEPSRRRSKSRDRDQPKRVSASEVAAIAEREQPTRNAASDVVIGSKGDVVISPSSVSKAVTWGENETKHYEVESPSDHREEFVSSAEVPTREVPEEIKQGSNSKTRGWGALAGAIMGVSVGAVAAAVDSVKTSKSEEDNKKPETYEYRGVIVEPDSPPRSRKSSPPRQEREPSPPAPGPKPTSSQVSHIPGSFDDDIEFTAAVAAGLQDTGFDPDIVINDPAFRRRDSPPGSNDGPVYRSPFAETVSDLGTVKSHNSGDPGFVIGEIASTPQDWQSVSPPREEETPTKLSKKEQKKRDKARRQSGDVTPLVEAPLDEVPITKEVVEEPESYFVEPKLSKKEQKKRDKEAQRQRMLSEDVPPPAEPSIAEQIVAEPESYFETPKKSKKSKKASSSFDETQDESSRDSRSASVPVDAYADVQNGDDDWTTETKKPKKSKRDSDRYDSPARSVPSSEVGTDERSSSKKSKRDSSRYDSPARSEVASEVGSSKKKDKSKRRSESYDVDPTEISLPPSTPSESSEFDDLRKTRKSDSGIFSSADRGDSRSVARSVVSAGASRYDDDEPRKSKKKSRSGTKDDFDDTRSVASAPAGDDWEDSKKSKKKEKEKDKRSSGFFGFFGSKSESGARDESPKGSKDDAEDTKKKKKKRSSTSDASGLYGGIGATSVSDLSQSMSGSNGKSNGNGSHHDYDQYEDGTRSDGEREKKKSRSRSASTSSKKDSFLGNAGTLGAGVGIAGAAVAIAAQQYQQSKAANTNDSETTESSRSMSFDRPSEREEALDPDIQHRVFRPSIDPQYGDLLPLPPSGPASPNIQPVDELPGLPDSRPGTPEADRTARERAMSAISSFRKSQQETPTKSPSQSAVPVRFLLGNRSSPPSPVASRSSPMQSPAAPNQDPLTFPKYKSRPTSWEGSKEFRPLYLVESHRRGSNVQLTAAEEAALPPSQATSRSSSQHDVESSSKGFDALHDSTDPLSIDIALARSSSPTELLGSQQSTPKAGSHDRGDHFSTEPLETPRGNDGDYDLPSRPRERSSNPAAKQKSHISDQDIAATVAIAGIAAAASHLISSSMHEQDDKLIDLPLKDPEPAQVDPVTKDRSSYLLKSSPIPLKFDELDTHTPIYQPKFTSDRQVLDNIKEQNFDSLAENVSAEKIQMERDGALESLSGAPIRQEMPPEDPAAHSMVEVEPAEEFAFTKSKKSRKEKRKSKGLSQVATEDDLPTGSRNTVDTSLESPVLVEKEIVEDAPIKSKAEKKKGKKKGKSVLAWEDTEDVQQPAEEVFEQISNAPELIPVPPSLFPDPVVQVEAPPVPEQDKKGKSIVVPEPEHKPEPELQREDETDEFHDALDESHIHTPDANVTPDASPQTDEFFTPLSKKNKKQDKKKSKSISDSEDAVVQPPMEGAESQDDVFEDAPAPINEPVEDFAPPKSKKSKKDKKKSKAIPSWDEIEPVETTISTAQDVIDDAAMIAEQSVAKNPLPSNSKKDKKKRKSLAIFELDTQAPADPVVSESSQEILEEPESIAEELIVHNLQTVEDQAIAADSEKAAVLSTTTTTTATLSEGQQLATNEAIPVVKQTVTIDDTAERNITEGKMIETNPADTSLSKQSDASHPAIQSVSAQEAETEKSTSEEFPTFEGKKSKKKKRKSEISWEPEEVPTGAPESSSKSADLDFKEEMEPETVTAAESFVPETKKNKKKKGKSVAIEEATDESSAIPTPLESDELLQFTKPLSKKDKKKGKKTLSLSENDNAFLEQTLEENDSQQDISEFVATPFDEKPVEDIPESLTSSNSKKSKKKSKKLQFADFDPELSESQDVLLDAEKTIEEDRTEYPDFSEEFTTSKKNKKKGKNSQFVEFESDPPEGQDVVPDTVRPIEDDHTENRELSEEFSTSKKGKKKSKKSQTVDVLDDKQSAGTTNSDNRTVDFAASTTTASETPISELTPVGGAGAGPIIPATSLTGGEVQEPSSKGYFPTPVAALEVESSKKDEDAAESMTAEASTLNLTDIQDSGAPSVNVDAETLAPDGLKAGYKDEQLSLARQLQEEFSSGSKKSKKDKKKRQSLPSTPDRLPSRSRAIDDLVEDHHRARSLSIGPSAERSEESPATTERANIYSEDQLEFARQLKAEFENKKSKKEKKGRKGRSLTQDDDFATQDVEQPQATEIESGLIPQSNLPDDRPKGDGFAAGYQEDQLSLARQLQAEFGSASKKSKKDKKRRSTSQTPLEQDPAEDYFGEQFQSAEPIEIGEPSNVPEFAVDQAAPLRDGLAVGYNEDQLELARQLKEEFSQKKSKKDKKEKKRQSLLRGNTDDDISSETLSRDLGDPSSVENPLPEDVEEATSLLLVEPEDEFSTFGKRSKKEKKAKKRGSLLRGATDDDLPLEDASKAIESSLNEDTIPQDLAEEVDRSPPAVEPEDEYFSTKKSKKEKKAKKRESIMQADLEEPTTTEIMTTESTQQDYLDITSGIVPEAEGEFAPAKKSKKEKKGKKRDSFMPENDIENSSSATPDADKIGEQSSSHDITLDDSGTGEAPLTLTADPQEHDHTGPTEVSSIPEPNKKSKKDKKARKRESLAFDSSPDTVEDGTSGDFLETDKQSQAPPVAPINNDLESSLNSTNPQNERQPMVAQEESIPQPEPEVTPEIGLALERLDVDVSATTSAAAVSEGLTDDFAGSRKSKKDKKKRQSLLQSSTLDDNQEPEPVVEEKGIESETLDHAIAEPSISALPENDEDYIFESSGKKSKKDKKKRKSLQPGESISDEQFPKESVPILGLAILKPVDEEPIPEEPFLEAMENSQDPLDDHALGKKSKDKKKRKGSAKTDSTEPWGPSTSLDPSSEAVNTTLATEDVVQRDPSEPLGSTPEQPTPEDTPAPAEDEWGPISRKNSKKGKNKGKKALKVEFEETSSPSTPLEDSPEPSFPISSLEPTSIEHPIDGHLDSSIPNTTQESIADPLAEWESTKKSKKDKKRKGSSKTDFDDVHADPPSTLSDSILEPSVPALSSEPTAIESVVEVETDSQVKPVSEDSVDEPLGDWEPTKRTKKDKMSRKEAKKAAPEDVSTPIEPAEVVPSLSTESTAFDQLQEHEIDPATGPIPNKNTEESFDEWAVTKKSKKDKKMRKDPSKVDIDEPAQELTETPVSELSPSQRSTVKDGDDLTHSHDIVESVPVPAQDTSEEQQEDFTLSRKNSKKTKKNRKESAKVDFEEPVVASSPLEMKPESSKEVAQISLPIEDPTKHDPLKSDLQQDEHISENIPIETLVEEPFDEWAPTKKSKKDKKKGKSLAKYDAEESAEPPMPLEASQEPLDETSFPSMLTKELNEKVILDDVPEPAVPTTATEQASCEPLDEWAPTKKSKKDKKRGKASAQLDLDESIESSTPLDAVSETPTEAVHTFLPTEKSSEKTISGDSTIPIDETAEPFEEWPSSKKTKKDKKKKKDSAKLDSEDLTAPSVSLLADTVVESPLSLSDSAERITSNDIAAEEPTDDTFGEWAPSKKTRKDKKKKKDLATLDYEEPSEPSQPSVPLLVEAVGETSTSPSDFGDATASKDIAAEEQADEVLEEWAPSKKSKKDKKKKNDSAKLDDKEPLEPPEPSQPSAPLPDEAAIEASVSPSDSAEGTISKDITVEEPTNEAFEEWAPSKKTKKDKKKKKDTAKLDSEEPLEPSQPPAPLLVEAAGEPSTFPPDFVDATASKDIAAEEPANETFEEWAPSKKSKKDKKKRKDLAKLESEEPSEVSTPLSIEPAIDIQLPTSDSAEAATSKDIAAEEPADETFEEEWAPSKKSKKDKKKRKDLAKLESEEPSEVPTPLSIEPVVEQLATSELATSIPEQVPEATASKDTFTDEPTPDTFEEWAPSKNSKKDKKKRKDLAKLDSEESSDVSTPLPAEAAVEAPIPTSELADKTPEQAPEATALNEIPAEEPTNEMSEEWAPTKKSKKDKRKGKHSTKLNDEEPLESSESSNPLPVVDAAIEAPVSTSGPAENTVEQSPEVITSQDMLAEEPVNETFEEWTPTKKSKKDKKKGKALTKSNHEEPLESSEPAITLPVVEAAVEAPISTSGPAEDVPEELPGPTVSKDISAEDPVDDAFEEWAPTKRSKKDKKKRKDSIKADMEQQPSSSSETKDIPPTSLVPESVPVEDEIVQQALKQEEIPEESLQDSAQPAKDEWEDASTKKSKADKKKRKSNLSNTIEGVVASPVADALTLSVTQLMTESSSKDVDFETSEKQLEATEPQDDWGSASVKKSKKDKKSGKSALASSAGINEPVQQPFAEPERRIEEISEVLNEQEQRASEDTKDVDIIPEEIVAEPADEWDTTPLKKSKKDKKRKSGLSNPLQEPVLEVQESAGEDPTTPQVKDQVTEDNFADATDEWGSVPLKKSKKDKKRKSGLSTPIEESVPEAQKSAVDEIAQDPATVEIKDQTTEDNFAEATDEWGSVPLKKSKKDKKRKSGLTAPTEDVPELQTIQMEDFTSPPSSAPGESERLDLGETLTTQTESETVVEPVVEPEDEWAGSFTKKSKRDKKKRKSEISSFDESRPEPDKTSADEQQSSTSGEPSANNAVSIKASLDQDPATVDGKEVTSTPADEWSGAFETKKSKKEKKNRKSSLATPIEKILPVERESAFQDESSKSIPHTGPIDLFHATTSSPATFENEPQVQREITEEANLPVEKAQDSMVQGTQFQEFPVQEAKDEDATEDPFAFVTKRPKKEKKGKRASRIDVESEPSTSVPIPADELLLEKVEVEPTIANPSPDEDHAREPEILSPSTKNSQDPIIGKTEAVKEEPEPITVSRKGSKKDKKKGQATIDANTNAPDSAAPLVTSWADGMEEAKLARDTAVSEAISKDESLSGMTTGSPANDFVRPSKKGKKTGRKESLSSPSKADHPSIETDTPLEDSQDKKNDVPFIATAGAVAIAGAALLSKSIDGGTLSEGTTPTRKLSKKEKRKMSIDKRTPKEDMFDDPALWEGADPMVYEETKEGQDDAGSDGFWSAQQEDVEESVIRESQKPNPEVHIDVGPPIDAPIESSRAITPPLVKESKILPTVEQSTTEQQVESSSALYGASEPPKQIEPSLKQSDDVPDEYFVASSKKDKKKKKAQNVDSGVSEKSTKDNKTTSGTDAPTSFGSTRSLAEDPPINKGLSFEEPRTLVQEPIPAPTSDLGQQTYLQRRALSPEFERHSPTTTRASTPRSSRPRLSDLPIVLEENLAQVEAEDHHRSHHHLTEEGNRDSGFLAESPIPPHQRGFADHHEHVRDSGVHLRDDSPAGRVRTTISSTDAALARLSWPSVNEDTETVDLHRSQRSKVETPKKHVHDEDKTPEAHDAKRSKSGKVTDFHHSHRTTDEIPSASRKEKTLDNRDLLPSQRTKDEPSTDLHRTPTMHGRKLGESSLIKQRMQKFESPDLPKPSYTKADLQTPELRKLDLRKDDLQRSQSPKLEQYQTPELRKLDLRKDDLQRSHSPKPEQYQTPPELRKLDLRKDDLQRSQSPKLDQNKTPKLDRYGELHSSSKPRAEKPQGISEIQAAGLVAGVAVAGASLGFAAARKLSQEKRPDSAQSQKTTPNINRLRTPDIKRPDSVSSNRSGTPPLRRTDRQLSGDLRSLSQRSKPDLAKEAELAAVTASTVNTANPTANEGRVRAKDMADVYDGFGEGRMGSPRSPTRPHSMRRRQSMQVLDLESRVEQLAAENRMLAEAKAQAERTLMSSQNASSSLVEKDSEIDSLKRTLEWLQNEVQRLKEVNEGLTSANVVIARQHSDRYGMLENQHAELSRELQETRDAHNNLSAGMDGIVKNEVQTAVLEKDLLIAQLRAELNTAQGQIREMQREMQRQILASKSNDVNFLTTRDEDYFDNACQQLCQHVQQWVLRFSKFSDMRACRLTSEINNDKTIDRLDNAILDGSDVDSYLSDRVKRRDVFMSMTMTMVWEFIFTRYLFGMDREQRQKLKSLEKLLSEVGPQTAVHQWRATTLTLLSKREAFVQQREQDTQAVVHAVLETLSEILPPPTHLEAQIEEQLTRVMKAAVDLSIEMRTQRAEYMMLPPLQPEYDANGDLASKVSFNSALMNERSGDTVSNEDLETQKAVVRIVLFPLVVKKGDDKGEGDEEIVVCPAQVLVAKAKKARFMDGANHSRISMQSSMPAGEENVV